MKISIGFTNVRSALQKLRRGKRWHEGRLRNWGMDREPIFQFAGVAPEQKLDGVHLRGDLRLKGWNLCLRRFNLRFG